MDRRLEAAMTWTKALEGRRELDLSLSDRHLAEALRLMEWLLDGRISVIPFEQSGQNTATTSHN